MHLRQQQQLRRLLRERTGAGRLLQACQLPGVLRELACERGLQVSTRRRRGDCLSMCRLSTAQQETTSHFNHRVER